MVTFLQQKPAFGKIEQIQKASSFHFSIIKAASEYTTEKYAIVMQKYIFRIY